MPKEKKGVFFQRKSPIFIGGLLEYLVLPTFFFIGLLYEGAFQKRHSLKRNVAGSKAFHSPMSPSLPRDHAEHRAQLHSIANSVFGPPLFCILRKLSKWNSPKEKISGCCFFTAPIRGRCMALNRYEFFVQEEK